jgi:tRNA1(Val) A37 N6-methylase TrmN6
MDSSVQCYACQGTGTKEKKVKIDKKWIIRQQQCNACEGKGNIIRTKRKNEDGSYRKKRIERSYPTFVASGPHPLGQRDNPYLDVLDNEELCYLVGNWKIYQRLDRHRYSTDDLVTSWYACQHTHLFGYINATDSLNVLDMGCGLGSVLLTNAWQLPNSKVLGIEAQADRYDLACKSVEYNIGKYPSEQQRIKVLLLDLRNDTDLSLEINSESYGFDMITGTPPYFPMQAGQHPGCLETTGCLFEARGGVEDYIIAAAKQLRRPSPVPLPLEKLRRPSLFVMCNTALTSLRVYAGCHSSGLSVIKRIDVIPKYGKPVLFCIFVIVLNEWITSPSSASLFPVLTEYNPPKNISIDVITSDYRITDSLRGETIEVLTVRDSQNQHTVEYQNLLSSLGKPHSGNKEVFNI